MTLHYLWLHNKTHGMCIQLKGKNIRKPQLDDERFQFLYLTLTLNQVHARN